MRILHIAPTANPEGGGPIEGVKQRAAVLQSWGHEVEVVTLDEPGSEWLATYPLQIAAVGRGGDGYGYSERLRPWIVENAGRFDGFVVNGLWQYHGIAARQALRALNRPYVIFTHGMLDPWFRKTYRLKHLKKSLYWLWAEHKVVRDAAAVLFTSQEEMILARGAFWPYRVRERVVAYGTAGPVGDPEAMKRHFLNEFPATQNKRILLYLSRIHPKKGCDLLLEAFGRVAVQDPSLQLVMAGPDQEGWVAELKRRAEQLGIGQRVVWPGMLKGDLKWGAFVSAEVFILPSHQENFGIVVAEALACGRPALISDRVNIWREVAEERAGLVAPDTQEGVSGLLERWLRLSAEERTAMGARALDAYRRHFDVTQSATSLLQILNEVQTNRSA